MNDAAKLVCDSLLGLDFQTFFLYKNTYTVFPPTMKTICKAIRHFAMLEIPLSKALTDAVNETSTISEHLYNGMAILIANGDDSLTEQVKDDLLNTPMIDIPNIYQKLQGMMGVENFFICAVSARKSSEIAASMKRLETKQ